MQLYSLHGRHIRLEPLAQAHHPALCEAGLIPELWRWTPQQITTPAEMQSYMDTTLAARAKQLEYPFATIDAHTGALIGSTRFMNIETTHRRLEIGSTWITPTHQRTPVNTEAKYLMLRHAFEHLNCLRVEFKTDVLNMQSRNAILRIGAKQEGVFRNHLITQSGRVRDTIWFSIIDTEWPGIKKTLEHLLGARTNTNKAAEKKESM